MKIEIDDTIIGFAVSALAAWKLTGKAPTLELPQGENVATTPAEVPLRRRGGPFLRVLARFYMLTQGTHCLTHGTELEFNRYMRPRLYCPACNRAKSERKARRLDWAKRTLGFKG